VLVEVAQERELLHRQVHGPTAQEDFVRSGIDHEALDSGGWITQRGDSRPRPRRCTVRKQKDRDDLLTQASRTQRMVHGRFEAAWVSSINHNRR
jgi:hypothetical protein